MEEENTLGNRLNWAIKRKMAKEKLDRRITNAQLAEVAGVSKTAVGYWFAGSNGIQAAQARPLGDYLNVNSYWLETGEGMPEEAEISELHARQERYMANHTSVSAHKIDGYRPPSSLDDHDYHVAEGVVKYNDVVIPQYRDIGGAMGHGVMLKDQPGEFHSLQVSADWIDKNIRNYTAKSNLAVVTGFGDSMKGMFNPGDPLIVDRGVTTVEYDGVYFFRVGDEGFIKRLQRVPGEGLIAISQNKEYRDWVIRPEMSFEIFARVIKVWKSDDL